MADEEDARETEGEGTGLGLARPFEVGETRTIVNARKGGLKAQSNRRERYRAAAEQAIVIGARLKIAKDDELREELERRGIDTAAVTPEIARGAMVTAQYALATSGKRGSTAGARYVDDAVGAGPEREESGGDGLGITLPSVAQLEAARGLVQDVDKLRSRDDE